MDVKKKTENVNGLSEEIIPVTKTVLNTSDETDRAVNINNSNKSATPKLLKKSQSEHLDLINKNVRSVNGSSAQDSDSTTAKKKHSYDYDFLLSLRNSPISTKKPENIPKLDLVACDVSHRARTQASRSEQGDNGNIQSLMGNSQFVPVFARSSPRGGTPNRRSQHGKQGGKDSSRSGGGSGSGGSRQNSSSKPNIIQINLSRDVKLNESENAWKPKVIKKEDRAVAVTATDAEKETLEDLCKKFRSILNKLSPQNFQKLISQVPGLKIDTRDKLASVIDLVFEKAIDEPGFSETYALMCKELEQIKVKHPQSDGNGEQIVSFRKLIIKRCQDEFEKASVAERVSSVKQKEIDECTDLEKKKELLLSLEEEERKLRVRSVGNVRFIGELFKQKYINSNTMIGCIGSLIKKLEEETMECLCKLLSTIGKDLEKNYNINLQTYFNEMKTIAEDKKNKLNSRIRFMLKDLIELRLNGWIPRQKLSMPKKLDDLESDMDRMSMNKNPSKYTSSMSQRDDRMYSGRNTGSRSVTEDGGWSVAPPRNRGPRQPYVVDSAKLKMMNTSDKISDISLQPSTNAMWGRGSNTKKDVPAVNQKSNLPSSGPKKSVTKTSNAFTLLGDLGSDTPVPDRTTKEVETKKTILTDENFARSTEYENLKKDFLNCIGDPYAELLDNIKHNFEEYLVPSIVRELIVFGLEFKKSRVVQVIGRAVGTLVKTSALFPEQFFDAFQKSLDILLATNPSQPSEFWDLLSKFIWAVFKEYQFSLWDLHMTSPKIISVEKGFDFLLAIFMEKVEDSNEVHVVKKLWEDAGNMNLTDWMSADDASEFLKCMPLEFLSVKEKEPVTEVTSNASEKILASLSDLMGKKTPLNQVKQWITQNVENKEDPPFINALTEALYTYALCTSEFPEPRFDKERLNTYYPLLTAYVANKRPLELECLFAIQNLMDKLEHPQGIVLQIFEHLWESGEAVSNVGFFDWENDTTKPEGKGVMLMTLTSFYTNLKVIDDSSSDDSEDVSMSGDD